MKSAAAEKSADVQTARASLQAARQYVETTRSALVELQQQRESIVATIAALEAKPPPWREIVDEMVDTAIDNCAAQFRPALVHHIRSSNPNLERRGSYDDLPLFRFGNPNDLDGVSAAALCYFEGDRYKQKLRELLLTFDAPHAPDECISRKDRETQRAELDEQMRATDAQIAQLQGELDQLKGL